MSKVPILFLGFNRPEETAKSFECIKKYEPENLYVALDGPRTDDERKLCDAVESIVKDVNWDCRVQYLIRKENLGCGKAVNEAIDWFFKEEESGIIYEDDIIAGSAFFKFCEAMLEHYRDDERIWLVTGNNLLGEWKVNNSYFFSKIGAIWGWATWKRTWIKHDKKIQNWPEIKKRGVMLDILPADLALAREKIMDKVFAGEIDTWDYQFTYTRLINSGLSVVPCKNLVSNIGFSQNATHTFSEPQMFPNKIMDFKTESLSHPNFIVANLRFDSAVFKGNAAAPNFSQKLKRILKVK